MADSSSYGPARLVTGPSTSSSSRCRKIACWVLYSIGRRNSRMLRLITTSTAITTAKEESLRELKRRWQPSIESFTSQRTHAVTDPRRGGTRLRRDHRRRVSSRRSRRGTFRARREEWLLESGSCRFLLPRRFLSVRPLRLSRDARPARAGAAPDPGTRPRVDRARILVLHVPRLDARPRHLIDLLAACTCANGRVASFDSLVSGPPGLR